MVEKKQIAIVGGGPAGAFTAEQLAARGHGVRLFERKGGAWEKPCGGGLTAKAIKRYPFLRDSIYGKTSITKLFLLDPNDRRVELNLDPEGAIWIYSRRDLNELMIQRALRAGAQLLPAHVKEATHTTDHRWRIRVADEEWEADALVIANGARSLLLEKWVKNFSPSDYAIAMSYHLPRVENLLRVKFLRRFLGYLWTFPRVDHLSVGICSKLTEHPARDLKKILQDFAEKIYGPQEFDKLPFHSALIPAPEDGTLARMKFCDAAMNWMAVGDAAGLVDPITGEGLYYALRSAELAAAALDRGTLDEYPQKVRAEMEGNFRKAAQIARYFYQGSFLGAGITTRMIQFARTSRSIHRILTLLFEEQDYLNLKSRLKKKMLLALCEAALGWRPTAR